MQMRYTYLSVSRNASVDNVILEQNDYLPFGTKVAGSSQPGMSANRYRYAGKEEQRIGSFNSQLLDFGARYYDAYTCSWNAIDPLANKYFGMSPYNYCGNDPVNRFDPDGAKIVVGHWYQRIAAKYSNDSFVSKVNTDINRLKEMDPTLKQMFETMENSNEVITILNSNERKGDKKGKNAFNPKTNTLYYDPDNFDSPLGNEETRDPIVALAHEGGHGEKKVNGISTTPTKQDEEDLRCGRGKEKQEEATGKYNNNKNIPYIWKISLEIY